MTRTTPIPICLIPGDGVGQEVIPAAAQVLTATGLPIEFVPADAGWGCFERTGDALPDATVAAVRRCGVALFGATQSPLRKVAGYRSPILAMRRVFDLYANVRPTGSLPVPDSRPGLDFVIFRENTEGLYSGRERREGDTAIAERVITRAASERIARAACDEAARRASAREPRRAALTIVHKANVLGVTDGLFRDTAREVAAAYPMLDVGEMLVDAAAMWLVKDPARFDVIVTTNLFGDILSDAAAGLVGGLGVAPSANLGPDVAVFEPVHGSAPDIAGRGIANPVGAILSAAMLLDRLDEPSHAQRVRAAVAATLVAGDRTPDLGGAATTGEVTRAIIERLENGD